MPISAQIVEDMKTAMKAKDTVALNVVRGLKSAIKYAAIEKFGADGELDDTDAIAVVRKEIKKRQDSVTSYEAAARQDLADTEKAEIAVLEKYLPAAMALFCANVNSYRRLTRYLSAPINVHWGYDNRTAGLRVPMSGPEDRRVENRVGGADANPYIAIAASLVCGYLGMVEGLQPSVR